MLRLMDICIAFIALMILSPVIIVIAILIRIKLGKPILFTQVRPGMHAKPFKIYKFRTMYDSRDSQGELLADSERFTPFGRLLRNYSFDELPQLWNVLKGDLSLVGPRPLLMEYVPLYNEEQTRRMSVRPGITGWAQINGRNAISWEQKFALDVWYVDNRSLWLNLKILMITFWRVMKPHGVNKEADLTMEPFRGTDNPLS